MQHITDSFVIRLNDLVARVEKNAAKYGSRTAMEMEVSASAGVDWQTLTAAEKSSAVREVIRQLQGSIAR